MKISDRTLTLLKNFSAINSNLLICPGSRLTTWAVAKNIVAEADVEEKFPCDFGIFNLSEFLGAYSLFNSPPDITFCANELTLKEGKSTIRYVAADKSVLTFPSKKIPMPTPDVEFKLSASQLGQLLKSAATLGVQDVAFIGDGKAVTAQVLDKKNSSSNKYTVDLDVETTETFSVYFKIENFKQIPDDYQVSLSSKNISRFIGSGVKCTYYIAVEADSTFS